MENTNPSTGKYSLNFGLLLGAVAVAFQLMLFFVDAHATRNPAISVVSIVLAIAIIFWGILSYKKANGGHLKVGEAVKMGAGMALISGIISIIYTLILTNVLDPEYASKMIDLQMAEAAEQGTMTTDQIAEAKEMSMKFFWVSYPVGLIFSVVLGLIIGLVGGLIFKKSA